MEIKNTYVVPVLNNYTGLVRLLDTLEKHTPANYRVIVIHNGACRSVKTEEEEKLIALAKNKVHLWIDTYRNLGFAKSMNTGIRLADTEYVTCANDDVELMYNEWWDEVEAIFAENPDLGGFNPHSPCNKQHTGARCVEYPYKEEFDAKDIENIKEYFIGQRWYQGCCTYFTIFRKKMFDEVGYFDESFGQGSGEDYDLCVRAARSNWRVCGGSRVIVWHWWGNTKDNMPVEENNVSNFNLIVAGNQNMERKWGKHIDKDPQGWSVSGQGGPQTPFDAIPDDNSIYKFWGKWFQIKEL